MISANLGFPRIGVHRELKKALDDYWAGHISVDVLVDTARILRARHWQWQRDAGIVHIPSNDFSLYDHVLDTAVMLGAIPHRFGWRGGDVGLETYFAMARGNATAPALEMTKWFDTNYHYLVPELDPEMPFALSSTKILDEFQEALDLGISTRPVLIGPLTFLYLARCRRNPRLNLFLAKILPVYQEILKKLAQAGAEWVQIDEPILVLDMQPEEIDAFRQAYKILLAGQRPMVCLTTYFGSLADKLDWLMALPSEAIHIDLVSAPEQLVPVLQHLRPTMRLSLGVVNGRNVWRVDLSRALTLVHQAVDKIGGNCLMVAPSCSLLHCPVDLALEMKLAKGVAERLAFAKQKLEEVRLLTCLGQSGPVKADIVSGQAVAMGKQQMPLAPEMFHRALSYDERRPLQQRRLRLPLFPTTTIGSFPQTSSIRKIRAAFRKGELSRDDYRRIMQNEIAQVIRFQEGVGLDVLVHGEPERSDMVEYFAEMLAGFAVTENGWVQSYGSRCIKPPIIFGDVARHRAMTVTWIGYAQSLAKRPVKGMLTGPVTMLQWSFAREDQLRRVTAFQIALAIREEVRDLEAAGINVIQIDEPAFREGAPLRAAACAEYYAWAAQAFRLAAGGAAPSTQIHSHMCYADFNEIVPAIAALDADVISIEASRSGGVLLDAFAAFKYPAAIGPGVYDVHSPRVPTVAEMEEMLKRMLSFLRPEQIWVNPDCGLKTRAWPETSAALQNMVTAAQRMRKNFSGQP